MKVETYTLLTDHIWKCCVSTIRNLVSLGLNVRVRIDIKPHPKSERQLGYVWACLYPYLKNLFEEQTDKETGEIVVMQLSLDDIHLYHVELFNEQTATGISKAIDLGLGLGPRIIKTRMSDWNAAQMSAYIEWLLRFYAVRSVELPEADQFWKERGIKNSRDVELPRMVA